jgi:hypothetical protein
MDNLISLEFLSQQSDAVLKAWAIVIPLLVVLLWVAWKMGEFLGPNAQVRTYAGIEATNKMADTRATPNRQATARR